MSRLVAFGCSHTYANGVMYKKKESWPAVLAQLMGLELLNLGEPGASNRFINMKYTKQSFF